MGQEISGLLERGSSIDGLENRHSHCDSTGSCCAGKENVTNAATNDDDSDSDDSGSGPLDILGMEDSASSDNDDDPEEERHQEQGAQNGEDIRAYMSELDEQLEELLDVETQ